MWLQPCKQGLGVGHATDLFPVKKNSSGRRRSVIKPGFSPPFVFQLFPPSHLVAYLHDHTTIATPHPHRSSSRLRVRRTHKPPSCLSKPVTPRRVPTSSRPAARSATPSRRTAATRSAPRSTASLAARRARSTASPTPTPTSKRASPGARTLCSTTSRTPRSTFPAQRWRSVASRRTRTGTTSSPTSRRPPHKLVPQGEA